MLLTRSGAAPGAAGLLSGWNIAVLVTAGFSLLGALSVLLACERLAGPEPDRSSCRAVTIAARPLAVRIDLMNNKGRGTHD